MNELAGNGARGNGFLRQKAARLLARSRLMSERDETMAMTFDCSIEAMKPTHETFHERPHPGGRGASTLVFPIVGTVAATEAETVKGTVLSGFSSSDSLPLMAAWCALVFRHFEQEDLSLAW